MLKIYPVAQVVLIEGSSLMGMPCTAIRLNEKGVDTEVNDIVTKVLESKLRTVIIEGKLMENIELKAIIEGLVSKGKLIYFVTDASDSIETIRRLKNVIFCLRLKPPSAEKNDVDVRNLPLLQDLDEISINVNSLEEYATAKNYIVGRTVTRPTVLFRAGKGLSDKAKLELMQIYLKDAENFNFKNRLINLTAKSESTE